MTENLEKLKRVLEFESEISKIRDIDFLLEKILGEARSFTGADAGSIYIREGDFLKFSYTQNDTLEAKLPPGKKLIYSTFSTPINSQSVSGHVAVTGEMVNISDAWNISVSAPYSFNRSYDEISGYRTKSMLTVPLTAQRGDISGVLQLINAKDQSGAVICFPESGMPVLAHLANAAANAVERAKLTRGIILRMNKMAELRDPKETGSHVNRVASYSVALYDAWAKVKGVSQVEIERTRDLLRLAAMLHDVGKVAISDLILKKPGRFTPEEFDIMKKHTVFGARLFGELYSDIDETAMEVTLNHHERWDGNGYPGHMDLNSGNPLPGFTDSEGKARGKKGEEIPLMGRIVAIADVFDALSNKRCYKDAWDPDAVVEELRNESGKMFDPELTEIFLQNIDTIHHISALYPD
ncbi:MAG: HD domain-containing protein [Geobacteraceae bacterium]|nr:HD domain-containing protein [Geobacteraceae bacterium]